MWLINTSTLSLEFLHSAEQVEYAILSHWWQEEEVTFNEFRDQNTVARAKKGYTKILECCELALEDGRRRGRTRLTLPNYGSVLIRREKGLDHSFVDTCCL